VGEMVIGRGGNWAKWLGGEMAKGRIGYGRNGEKIGRDGKWAKWHWAKWEYTMLSIFASFCVLISVKYELIKPMCAY
jgi:hypothetical protein